MNMRLERVLVFLVILTCYATVLLALAWMLPYAALLGLGVWFALRRPLAHLGRADADIATFARHTGDFAGKALEFLVRPLRDKNAVAPDRWPGS